LGNSWILCDHIISIRLLFIVLTSKHYHSSSLSLLITSPTMSNPSPPQTPLDCFAQAIQLITLAAVIDQRIAELVPVFAESFVTVSRLPKARSPLTMNIEVQESASFPKGTGSDTIVILHKVIRVLTLCTADCPLEVSRLIPLVTVHMIPTQQATESLPPTIVEGEHQACSSGKGESNEVANSTMGSLKVVSQQRKKSFYRLARVVVKSQLSCLELRQELQFKDPRKIVPRPYQSM
jgi:hypothetical protein